MHATIRKGGSLDRAEKLLGTFAVSASVASLKKGH
jgi:hypothetical protein